MFISQNVLHVILFFQDDILTFEGEQQAELLTIFQPVYLKLVDTFILKSLLPPDNALTSEEKEMFRCYRQDICDTYVSLPISLLKPFAVSAW